MRALTAAICWLSIKQIMKRGIRRIVRVTDVGVHALTSWMNEMIKYATTSPGSPASY